MPSSRRSLAEKVRAEGEALRQLGELVGLLRQGAVGVVPTDTIYGLTADALNPRAVADVDAIKQRAQPATIIPPSLEWAARFVAPRARGWLEVLMEAWPGATLLLPFREAPGPRPAPSLVASGLIGLRRPVHWVTDLAAELDRPLLTTSVNRTGQPPMTSLTTLDPEIAAEVTFIVNAGPLRGRASPIWFCDGPEPRLLERA